jgi:hypothetical protein
MTVCGFVGSSKLFRGTRCLMLKTEAAESSDTLATIYHKKWWYHKEQSLTVYQCKSLKSQMKQVLYITRITTFLATSWHTISSSP